MDGQQDLICASCLEVKSRPKTLQCEHVFCEDCVTKLCKMNGRLIKCPDCRLVQIILSSDHHHPIPAQRIHDNAVDGQRNKASQRRPVPAPRRCNVLPVPKPKPRIPPKPAIEIPNTADPLQSFVEKHGLKRARIGKQISITIQLCNGRGQVIAGIPGRENITSVVDLRPRPRDFQLEEIKPSLTKEGKYNIKYQAKRCGMHEISIFLQNRIIKGAPVNIRIEPRGLLGCEIKGHLEYPTDVAEYHGNFLVTDSAHKAVLVIDQAGREVMKLKVPENLKEHFLPFAVTTFENSVFVTDLNTSSAFVYDNVNAFPRQFGGTKLKSPTGIAVSRRNRDIFIVDNISRKISVFNCNLQFLRVLNFHTGPAGNGRVGNQETLHDPHMMTINSNGDKLFIVDRGQGKNDSIKIINVSDNTLVRTINVSLFNEQARPYGITLDQDDNIFVSVEINTKDIKSGGISVYNIGGNYLGSIKSLKLQSIVRPYGLFVSPSPGNMSSVVYVVDANSTGKKGSLKGFLI